MEDYLVKPFVIKVQYEHMPSVPLKLLAKRKEDMIHGVLLLQR